MSEGDVALACAAGLVDELVRRGMEHASISPGSRSTPLALALARHSAVRVHVHLDERASAFFALGIAKATGRLVAVACTSGTAAANLFPAVVEANMSRVPLVLLTADRPPDLRGVGANQTIDQLELYGRHVRLFVDAEVPGDRSDPGYWRSLAARAVHAAASAPPGPVHLNLPFREPLVPSEAASPRPTEAGAWPVDVVSGPSGDQVEALAAEIVRTERGAIMAGTLRLKASPVIDLARAAGWPLIAEPTSGLRAPGALSAGQFLLANGGFASAHAPDLVVQFGAAPTSRAGLAFVSTAKRLLIVDPDQLVADPNRMASMRLEVDAVSLASEVVARLPGRPSSLWLTGWSKADTAVRRAVDELMDSWAEPYEGRIARDLAAAIPDDGVLVVGSSMPVRDLDAYMAPRNGLRVIGNRGASGIDGLVSTALGVAATGARTYALCGDLSLLHDAGSLLWSAHRGYDAVFVVPNNEGGAVFSFTGQGALPEFGELFATPHGLDLGSLADAAGAGYTKVTRASDLVAAVGRGASSGGVWIVEVPSDRERNLERHAEVHAAVAEALALGSANERASRQ